MNDVLENVLIDYRLTVNELLRRTSPSSSFPLVLYFIFVARNLFVDLL